MPENKLYGKKRGYKVKQERGKYFDDFKKKDDKIIFIRIKKFSERKEG